MKFCFTRERLILASLLCAVATIVLSLIFPSTTKAPFKASEVELIAASNSYSVATSFESTFNDALKSPQAFRIPSPPNRRPRPIRPFLLTRPVPSTYPMPPVYPTPPYGYVSPTYPVAPARPIPPQRPWFLY